MINFFMEEENLNPSQEQIHGLLFGERLGWQAIIYDLINTEQLNPWDINIALLTNKYLERIRELEEANFFVSSKVLLAASLLLRIKSEILLSYDLKTLDEILFGKQEEKKYVQKEIDFSDENIPELIPRTPLPRTRKVTLQELMASLGKAIKTENRRIKRFVVEKQRQIEANIAIPRTAIDLKDKITEVYGKINASLKRENKIPFSSISGANKNEKVNNFIPLLYLDHQRKIFAEQDVPFEEIWIWLKSVYMNKHRELLDVARKEAESEFDKEYDLDNEINNQS